ncbi:hypothetical protein HPB47_026369 [Ixodes persulcatus]|uniref:Uncharacterized protein n=1 Tax=Ixodes persulcatus TaxID=34615 RepID=A0AC60Q071_IXOPE|nr:hypothetical protein HPB47_026369 [Ixodes persulcatus]
MGPHDLRSLLRKLMRQTYVRTPAMSRGSALEGPAKECYKTKQAQHQNLVLSKCELYVMQGRPYIGASPDALVECQCCEKWVLEVKCPESMVKFLGEITEKSVGDMPSMKLKHTTTVFCQVQHAAQNRFQALLLDPLAVDKPTTSAVVNRNHLLHAEMDAFSSFMRSQAPMYRDVINYLNRIASFGVLPEAS